MRFISLQQALKLDTDCDSSGLVHLLQPLGVSTQAVMSRVEVHLDVASVLLVAALCLHQDVVVATIPPAKMTVANETMTGATVTVLEARMTEIAK